MWNHSRPHRGLTSPFALHSRDSLLDDHQTIHSKAAGIWQGPCPTVVDHRWLHRSSKPSFTSRERQSPLQRHPRQTNWITRLRNDADGVSNSGDKIYPKMRHFQAPYTSDISRSCLSQKPTKEQNGLRRPSPLLQCIPYCSHSQELDDNLSQELGIRVRMPRGGIDSRHESYLRLQVRPSPNKCFKRFIP